MHVNQGGNLELTVNKKSTFNNVCKAVKKNGHQCKSFVTKDGLCSMHHPEIGLNIRGRSYKGRGEKKKDQEKLSPGQKNLMLKKIGFPSEFKSSEDVDKVMLSLINRITMGEIPATSGKVLLNLCQEANKKFRLQEKQAKKGKKADKNLILDIDIENPWEDNQDA